jgi:ATP-binding cassette subfamily C (CFTR/MRP) protein 10
VISALIKANVSFKRLKEFLSLENINWLTYYSFSHSNSCLETQDTLLLDINNADFKWKKDDSSVLNELNLEVKKGQLIGIIGKVGCGKTSLLHAIMSELTKTFGSIKINAEVCSKGFAYVGQDGWIKADTIRENILFGAKFNPDFYHKVIEACALIPDLEGFPNGDETFVGDNGVTLSGGQKTRLALARACYASDKQVYLFDGPFNSIDPNVAKKIYELCICDLLKDKTRILCTHHAEYLMNADLVLVVDKGKVIESGPGELVIPRFATLNFNDLCQDSCLNITELNTLNESNELKNHHSFDHNQNNLHKIIKPDLYQEFEHGEIDIKVYKYYCFSIGICLTCVTFLMLFLTQG